MVSHTRCRGGHREAPPLRGQIAYGHGRDPRSHRPLSARSEVGDAVDAQTSLNSSSAKSTTTRVADAEARVARLMIATRKHSASLYAGVESKCRTTPQGPLRLIVTIVRGLWGWRADVGCAALGAI